MVVKTYRGLLADGGQDRIRLQTIKGKVGYRIVKLELMGNAPGTVNYESILKIYKSLQSSIDGVVNFTDNTLLGAAYLEGSTSVTSTDHVTVIFDNETFNQDIYITHKEIEGNSAVNYYIELELIPLASDEAAITTVKAMRGTAVD